MIPVIHAENLSKAYQIGEFGTGSLTNDLQRWYIRKRGKEDPFVKIGETNERVLKGLSDVVWSLKDLNFEIRQGEAVGIIGRNGAGKSTLLKILSRITTPTKGSVKVKGRIASLLEVGTGFHPELTGRENIYLNGAILGVRKQEIKKKFDEIVEFSGVIKYIDTPVKRYSSGMYVRLAFAVAAHLESEILIIDEVLAVGDGEFQKRCLGKMDDVSKGEGRTVLFVSHDLNAVAQLCTHGILLKNGKIEHDGKIRDIVTSYLTNEERSPVYFSKSNSSNKRMSISSIKVINKAKEVCHEFTHDEGLSMEFEITINDTFITADLFVLILDSRKRRVFACEANGVKSKVTLNLEPNMLVRGDYSIHAFINIPKFEQLDVVEDVCHFKIIDTGSPMLKHADYDYGNVFGRYSWS